MSKTIEKTKYQEAYRCENGHIIPKYRQYGNFPVMDSIVFHQCCPDCGSKEISKVTGVWEREYKMNTSFFGKSIKGELIKESFVESIFSDTDRKLRKENLADDSAEGVIRKDLERICKIKNNKGSETELNVDFKFSLCQAVKTIFGDQGFIQTLANERGGNKYWVRFSDNKLDAWFWEDELVLINTPPFGFKK